MIIAGLVHILGEIWIDRITKQTVAQYSVDMHKLKLDTKLTLLKLKNEVETKFKRADEFNGISIDSISRFF